MTPRHRIGYPCMNYSLKATPQTFRLASYSPERMLAAVEHNLNSLESCLRYNLEHSLLFFRISSDLIPFASHRVCTFPWLSRYAARFKALGDFIRGSKMRISMHPDQFTLINAVEERIVRASIEELQYHVDLLTAMGLDATAKIQIHVGGVYGDKPAAIKRFIQRYQTLPSSIRDRLVIENDDRLFSLKDCLVIHAATRVPILFDVFHHRLLNEGVSLEKALVLAAATWRLGDGPMMVDYSSQSDGERIGKHAPTILLDDFQAFWKIASGFEMDIMLEIKDKELSALRAQKLMSTLNPRSSHIRRPA